ncbi:MAG: electron transfer flavoprotein subunit beta/FixA family protein [Deltaproteobacteria bacterium]|nr:MAG: electron transfer flavoprotein subunit beta/FixA family protein [Deltaproteobacteria bacterium]
MKIGVCVKVAPDTDTRIKISGDGAGIEESGIKWIVSPYDSFGIEEAVQTQEAQGGEVILFSAGPKDWQTQLRAGGLAVGAERAVIVDDPALAGTDPLGIARVLAAGIASEGCELVFTGKQAIDDDNVQVPAMVAELLGWPHVSFVTDFSTDGSTFTATRNVGGGTQEVVTGSLPVVITAERGLNTPRYAKLPAIMKAKRKKVDVKSLGDLDLSADDITPAVQLTNFSLPPERPAGRKLEGDVDTMVQELVRLLREEAKVI